MRDLFTICCIVGLGGCATTEPEPRDQHRYPTAQEAAISLGCSDEQLAMCIGINCELEDYYCADKDDVRKMFKADEFRRP